MSIKATINVGTEFFKIEVSNERDFRNEIRSAINNGTFYEFTQTKNSKTQRYLINTRNITSIVFDVTDINEVPNTSRSNMSEVPNSETPEELRAKQLAMQPEAVKFEAKAAAMKALKDAEDANKAKFVNTGAAKITAGYGR